MITDNGTEVLASLAPAADERSQSQPLTRRVSGSALLEWPRAAWLYGVLVVALYAPVVWETSRLWFTNDTYGHGALILPVSAGLVWLRRREIAQAAPSPSAWGMLWLVPGLAMLVGCYLLRVGYWAIWSAVPVLLGIVLLVHGRELWKIVAASVCLLVFAGPMPDLLTHAPQDWVQSASTTGAAQIMSTLGFPLVQHGNAIDLPQASLDVADVCSGFRKLIAFTAFGLVYGYLYPIGFLKRAILALAAGPIAVIANVLRICALIAFTQFGGVHALRLAHMPAEIAVVAISFGLFVALGRAMGCRQPRFSI